jgi:CubicO group peptidase (beta-lactamase class C family)
MRINHIPSVSVAVVRDGKVELLRSYGAANLEWDAPAGPDTAYQLASTTKPLTGTAVMLLVQEGKLSLEAPVKTYLPDAPDAWSGITIRHLASHTSGIPDDVGPIKNAEEGVRALAAKPLAFQPGSRSTYGIGGYVVLQRILEVVTGRPFPEFMRDRLFVPLGMTSTTFDHATNDGPFRAADTVRHRAGIYSWESGAQRIFWFHFGSDAYTAGGALSSAADLAAWAAALDSGRPLTDASLRAMWTPTALTTGEPGGFGIGWAVGRYRGRPTVGHSGGPALSDVLRFPDDKLTVIVLANQQKMYPYLAQGVADFLVPASTQPGPAAAPDGDAALTGRLRGLMAGMARGEVAEDLFVPAARADLAQGVRAFLVPYARSLGEPSSFALLEERRTAEGRTRVYRARYATPTGEKTVRWTFELDADGHVANFGPTAE